MRARVSQRCTTVQVAHRHKRAASRVGGHSARNAPCRGGAAPSSSPGRRSRGNAGAAAPDHATLRTTPGAGERRCSSSTTRRLAPSLPSCGRRRGSPPAVGTRRPRLRCQSTLKRVARTRRSTRPRRTHAAHGRTARCCASKRGASSARTPPVPPQCAPSRAAAVMPGEGEGPAAPLAYCTALHRVLYTWTATPGGRFLITRGAAVLQTWMLPFDEMCRCAAAFALRRPVLSEALPFAALGRRIAWEMVVALARMKAHVQDGKLCASTGCAPLISAPLPS